MAKNSMPMPAVKKGYVTERDNGNRFTQRAAQATSVTDAFKSGGMPRAKTSRDLGIIPIDSPLPKTPNRVV